ncbi:hypothetical protein BN1723_012376 [Verticillium longisporum]|uniref:Protein CAP22 n=1 Tax=Verticillium longisporum TaxID=100787 RepID=A0A0G4LH83_VERLO|nr:hypothetical protein HYQ44_018985 [Verticillium longisporum]CRK16605.1 hypothetical protein BN1708_002862 [Verticillium longisporum]CRK21386.1 hypothetical protein BN1723_012376 [Verticillium longisporum]
MYFNRFALAAASMATVALVNADLELDRDDYPAQCQNVCDPVARLGQLCNFDDNDRLDDRIEDQLEAQCFCTNNSFNVAQVAAQCAACMHNANRDTDDNEDINDIMFTCGFSSTSYDANAISTATGISVQATALTASSQLTTSLTGATPTNTNSQSTPTGSSNNNNNNGNGNNDDNSNNNNNNGNSNSNSQSTNEPSAANAIAPGFGTSALGISAYVAAAAVAGAMLLQ